MPNRIVIDARRIRDFGIGTYIRNLIRGLSTLDQKNHYILITGSEKHAELANLGPNFEIVPFRWKNKQLMSHLAFPFFVRGLSPDLCHIPLNAVPFGTPHPYIVTIHDVGSMLYGKTHGVRNEMRRERFRRGLLNAAKVIAVSNATRRDVETLIGIPPNRIRTIYNAPDPIFRPSAPAVAFSGDATFQYQPDEMQRILDRYQIHYPFLLYAGRTNPPKNIPRLVEAFSVLRGELAGLGVFENLRLIIIGDEISKYPSLRHAVIQSRVEDTVRFLGFVPIETLCVFYQSAAAFVFPSLYEGFGLPPLEAMACGTPVVVSGVSSLPEVVGDAALIVNPENVFDIARGMREVLLDRELRETLIHCGFQQVKRFSWESTASQVLAAYEEVASSGR